MDALDKTGMAEGAELHRAGSRAVGRNWPGSVDRITLEVQAEGAACDRLGLARGMTRFGNERWGCLWLLQAESLGL